MRLNPERLRALGQRPRTVGIVPHGPFAITKFLRSPGPTRLSGRMTALFMRWMLEAGRSIEYTNQELSPDYISERLRHYADIKTKRDRVFLPTSSSNLEVRIFESAEAPTAGESKKRDLWKAPHEHYISMGTSVPCEKPCPLCLPKPRTVPQGWKWRS